MATMKVLLREDIEYLGRRGDIVRVKAGFARNYLLPRRLAMVATSSNLKAIEQERAALQRREGREREAAKTLSEQLKEVSLEFRRKVSEQGALYGSVTTHDIAQALAERGLAIERRRLHLERPIKEPGSYTATVKLHRDVVMEVPVRVRAEGEPATVEAESSEGPRPGVEPSAAPEEPHEVEAQRDAEQGTPADEGHGSKEPES